jgi:hypothetical protein
MSGREAGLLTAENRMLGAAKSCSVVWEEGVCCNSPLWIFPFPLSSFSLFQLCWVATAVPGLVLVEVCCRIVSRRYDLDWVTDMRHGI